MIKFIDLFAGLGGMRLGFEQACATLGVEAECVLTSEIKPSAIMALNKNFVHKNMVGDITQVQTKDLPDFDFLLGGFPCQAFSTAGKQYGFADTRGTLFFEVERILKDKRPFGFILENVEGLVVHDRERPGDVIGRTLSVILQHLESLGYKVTWKVLNCGDFGVPQGRKRIFIIGTLKDFVSLEDFDKKRCVLEDILENGLDTVDSSFTKCLLSHYSVEELYGKAIKDKRGGKNNIHSWDIGLKGEINREQKNLLNKIFKERRKKCWAEEIGIEWMDGMPLTLEQIKSFCNYENLEQLLEDLVDKGYLVKEYPKKLVKTESENGSVKTYREQDKTKQLGYNIVAGKLSFEFTKILNPREVAPTFVATDISHIGVVDGNGVRRLTIRECLRSFGYPDTYDLSMLENSKNGLLKAFDLLGNTVVVPTVKSVSERVLSVYLSRE